MDKRGCNVFPASSMAEFSRIIESDCPNYAIIDLRLSDGTGLDAVESIRKKKRDAKIIVLTGYGAIATAVAAGKIGAIDYTYGASNSIVKTTIEFAYKQWFNMGIESTRGLEFGEAMQTPAMIKQRDPGIFGKLPPDLKRAGKNIFQQGRTVWNPIGRIFNGKVFPPFT